MRDASYGSSPACAGEIAEGKMAGAGAEGTLAASESTARLAARGGGERLSWLGAKNTDIAGIMAAAAMRAVMKKAFVAPSIWSISAKTLTKSASFLR